MEAERSAGDAMVKSGRYAVTTEEGKACHLGAG